MNMRGRLFGVILFASGLLVLLSLLGAAACRSRGGNQPSSNAASPSSRPAPEISAKMASQIRRNRLEMIEEDLANLIEQANSNGNASGCTAVIRRALREIRNLPETNVYPEVAGLEAGLLENLDAGAIAFQNLANSKEYRGQTVIDLCNQSTDEHTQEYIKNIEHQMEAEMGGSASASASIKVLGRIPVAGTAEASLKAFARYQEFSTGKYEAKGRDESKRCHEEKIKKIIEGAEAPALASLSDFFVRMAAWRGVNAWLKKFFPQPDDVMCEFYEAISLHQHGNHQKALALIDDTLKDRIDLLQNDQVRIAIIRVDCLHSLGEYQKAETELKSLRRGLALSRSLSILLGYIYLHEGRYQDALDKFEECCGSSTPFQEDEDYRLWLKFHPQEAHLGKIAALMALGRKDQGRQGLKNALGNYVTPKDRSFLDAARWCVSHEPRKALFEPLADLTAIKISAWAKRQWYWDDVGFRNDSAFTLTNVKLSVSSENADGSTDKRETRDAGDLRPGQTSEVFKYRLLMGSHTKRVVFEITCDQGNGSDYLTKWAGGLGLGE